jgi:hypothetical protein
MFNGHSYTTVAVAKRFSQPRRPQVDDRISQTPLNIFCPPKLAYWIYAHSSFGSYKYHTVTYGRMDFENWHLTMRVISKVYYAVEKFNARKISTRREIAKAFLIMCIPHVSLAYKRLNSKSLNPSKRWKKCFVWEPLECIPYIYVYWKGLSFKFL